MGGSAQPNFVIEHLGGGWHFQLDSVGCEVAHHALRNGSRHGHLMVWVFVSWRHWMHFMWSPIQFGNFLPEFWLQLAVGLLG